MAWWQHKAEVRPLLYKKLLENREIELHPQLSEVGCILELLILLGLLVQRMSECCVPLLGHGRNEPFESCTIYKEEA